MKQEYKRKEKPKPFRLLKMYCHRAVGMSTSPFIANNSQFE